MASTQRKMIPTRGSWMSLGFCGILPLSFIKNAVDQFFVKAFSWAQPYQWSEEEQAGRYAFCPQSNI